MIDICGAQYPCRQLRFCWTQQQKQVSFRNKSQELYIPTQSNFNTDAIVTRFNFPVSSFLNTPNNVSTSRSDNSRALKIAAASASCPITPSFGENFVAPPPIVKHNKCYYIVCVLFCVAYSFTGLVRYLHAPERRETIALRRNNSGCNLNSLRYVCFKYTLQAENP